MSKILENKYGFIRYRQGDHSDEYASIAMPEFQPALSLDRKKIGMVFFTASKKYADWFDESIYEEAEFTIMDLIKLSQSHKVVADVYIPPDILVKIADKTQVVLLFAPEEMTKKHYFDRADKDDIYQFIRSFPDGEQLLNNVVEALHYNSAANREGYVNSGFYYIERAADDTVEKTLELIEKHSGLF